MKYLDLPNLVELTSFMTNKEVGSLTIINGKIEAFSLVKRAPSQLTASSSSGSIEDMTTGPISGTNGQSTIASSSSSSSSSISKDGIMDTEGSKKAKGSSKSNPAKTALSINPLSSETNNTEISNNSLPPLPPPLSAASIKAAFPFPPTIPAPCSTSNAAINTSGVVQRPRAMSGGKILPPRRQRATSLGDLKEPSSKKLLLDLINALDDFFPDYDFEATKPEQFLIKEVNQVIQRVNESLAELTQERPNFLEKLWRSIDEVVSLKTCDVFSLVPDMAEDPFSDGTLWSFNYFFLNYELKQLVYFTCVAKSKFRRDDPMDITMDDDDDDDDNDDDEGDNNSDEDGMVIMEEGAEADSLDGTQDAPDWDGII